ncbi:hypothetical protein BC833DRAFT_532226 [Globomyces pollinis-pini]|nr:hypothetical protein BC833DRAFT_532226 [Globomyces pollinis-pini]
MLFWCAEHRRCIGFVILQSGESPKHVYTVLTTRYQILLMIRFNKIPDYIIYDNACNLSEYFLNRSPIDVIDSIIVTDGFHWPNHNNCGLTFHCKKYNGLKDIISVLHEQKNRRLDKLKSISTFMNYDSFAELMVYIIHLMNMREIDII